MISVIETALVWDDRSSGYQVRVPLKSFTHACPDAANGRFEAASESKIKNAKQIVLYALGFLCFSQKLSGKIFNRFRFCVFPGFLNVDIIKLMSDCYFHFLASNWVRTR